jgi:hypothetical protein
MMISIEKNAGCLRGREEREMVWYGIICVCVLAAKM